MTISKIIFITLILFISGFGLYLYQLHSLAIEGNAIFGQRCLKVNPPLISYKNSFIKFTEYLKNPTKYTADEAGSFMVDGYIGGMRKYIVEEDKWLETQKRFMNRWDYKLMEPWYIKQAAEYQWQMYEGYRDDAKYLLASFDAKELDEELKAKQKEARERRDKYSQLYFEFFDTASAIKDWRKIFGRVPFATGCNEENTRIPDTSGSMDWNESTPSSKPVNPDVVS